MASATAPRLQMQGIVKAFAGVTVLQGVNLAVAPGEVVALLGENGAGKSTLMKILGGDYHKDAGEILIDGEPVQIRTPIQAEALGVRMIYQELNYLPDLSITENILLGHLPKGRLGITVNWQRARTLATEALQALDMHLDPSRPLRSLTVAERQVVEIAKALSVRARILVMDEPTAALTAKETARLFDLIRNLRGQGVSIIYISHRLEEIRDIADRVTVLRDGRNVGSGPIDSFTTDDIVRMMVGREVSRGHKRQHVTGGQTLMMVKGLTRLGAFTDVSFELKRGEILGIYGLLGSGRLELASALFGDQPASTGEISLDAQPLRLQSPQMAKAAGFAFVPPDRKVNGLLLEHSVMWNLTLARLRKIAHWGILRHDLERELAGQWAEKLSLRFSGDLKQEMRLLSGGNQQKVVLGRWLVAGARILVLSEPTMGVDIGARADIYRLLDDLRQQGVGVLMASSDMEELEQVCDRVLVLNKGRVVAELQGPEITQEAMLSAAVGA